MYNFILQIITLVSFAIIILLFARALPRIPDTEQNRRGTGRFGEKIASRIPVEKLDTFANSAVEKLLRRVRVVIMKFDNLVLHRLNRLKKKNGTSSSIESIEGVGNGSEIESDNSQSTGV